MGVIGSLRISFWVVAIGTVVLAAELADRGGDPQLRRALNRIRERRGF